MAIADKRKVSVEEDHKAYHRRLLYVFVMIVLFLLGGMVIYHYIEGWRYIDSLYFSAATMTTVGYGDITPQTDVGKLLTVVYVFTGVGMALYGLSLITSHLVEVREEFWMERFGKIRFRHHRDTLWGRIKRAFSYRSDILVNESEKVNGYFKSKKK